MKRIRNMLVATLILGVSTHASAALMWVVENQSDQVFTVDVTTLTATLVGPTGVDVVFGGLGFAANDTLYAWNSPGNLYTVDQSTGAFTLIGGSILFGADTFDIDPVSGAAIAWSVFGTLNDVNLSTGATSFRVATVPFNAGIASAFGPDGTYYQTANGLPLTSVDINTGVVTVIGPTSPELVNTSLGYNPDDNFLYAIAIQNAAYPLFRIDPATGTTTFVGNVSGLPNNSDQQITMATFQFVPAQVPEPGVLALLGLALGVFGLIRRKNA